MSTKKIISRLFNAKVASLAILIIGVINLLSSFTSPFETRLSLLSRYIPIYISVGSRLLTVFIGLVLLVISVNLRKHKHNAWILTIIVLFFSLITHLLKGLDFEEISVTTVAIIYFLIIKNQFYAKSDKLSSVRAIKLFALNSVFIVTTNAIIIFDIQTRFLSAHKYKQALVEAYQFIIFENKNIFPNQLIDKFYIIFSITYIIVSYTYLLFLFIKPVLKGTFSTSDELQIVEAITDKYGKIPMAYQGSRNDKSFFINNNHTSYINYRIKNGFALSLGGPVGPTKEYEATINEFITFCYQHSWEPVIIQAPKESLVIYNRLNFNHISIGEDAIIPITTFNLEGSERKNLRNSINKSLRDGYSVKVVTPPISSKTLAEIFKISNEWLLHKKGPEKGFSLGRFDSELLSKCPLAIAYDNTSKPIAFANIITLTNDDTYSIDLMRKLDSANNSVMDLMFYEIIMWGRANGYKNFNLGLAALSDSNSATKKVVENIIHSSKKYLNKFYNFDGIYKYKSKFNPNWEKRYLVYKNKISLPAILTAIISIEND